MFVGGVHTSATQLEEITTQLMVDVKNIPPTAPSPYSFGNSPDPSIHYYINTRDVTLSIHAMTRYQYINIVPQQDTLAACALSIPSLSAP